MIPPEVSALLGRPFSVEMPEPLGRAAVRLYALALDDPNPLYLDPELARRSRHRGLLAPPTLICDTWQFFRGPLEPHGDWADRPRPCLPGLLARAGNRYRFHRPVRPGMRIRLVGCLERAFLRPGRSGHLLFLVSRLRYHEVRHDTLLAENEETMVHLQGPPRGAEAEPVDRPPEEEPISPPPRSPLEPLTWEEVQEGQRLPPRSLHLTPARMVAYAGATWDFSAVHHDARRAREVGAPAPFADGQMLGALLARLVTDWTGDPTALAGLEVRYRALVFGGDRVTAEGVVVERRTSGRWGWASLDVWIRDHRGRTVAEGRAEVRLARRG